MILSFTDPDADGSSLSQLASRNLYGPAVDQIFATEVANGSVLWALTDHQGTPRDWATRSPSTGTTTIAQHTRYTAFGAIESVTDATGNPLASSLIPLASFTGQLYDPDANLIYYRARWYDPQLGKFLTDDPMGFAAGDANVSRYVGNEAISNKDFSGLKKQLIIRVDQPGIGMDDDIVEGDEDVGHVYIVLVDTENPDATAVYPGFYPTNTIAPPTLLFPLGPILPHPGEIRNDKQTDYDVYHVWNIDDEQYNKISQIIADDFVNPPAYDGDDFACTDWALKCIHVVDPEFSPPETKIPYTVPVPFIGDLNFVFSVYAPGPFGEYVIQTGGNRTQPD